MRYYATTAGFRDSRPIPGKEQRRSFDLEALQPGTPELK